jgi:universal stress protein A
MSIATILVPTDFSDHAEVAFAKAYDLARQVGARLVVLHVRDESALRTAIKEGLLDRCDTDAELHATIDALVETRFAKLLAAVPSEPVAIEHLTQRGDAAKLIVEYAREINADMVVIGRRGAGMVMDLLSTMLGSVVEAVIRKSPCPVLVVRREHK